MKTLLPETRAFMGYLDEKGLKLTPRRELVLNTFLEHEGHRSVEDIFRVARDLDSKIGYTTVYRTIKLLVDSGLAREVDLADGVTRYEHLFNHAHHDHIVCLECGASIEFYNPEIEALQDAASSQIGFKTVDHR
ncbi:MAG TPA: Fur family transcriptional regulator, partial [Terriglobia bacterium]|nr:Fur family transcriptional regulator [Terriglobia bacterium]